MERTPDRSVEVPQGLSKQGVTKNNSTVGIRSDVSGEKEQKILLIRLIKIFIKTNDDL